MILTNFILSKTNEFYEPLIKEEKWDLFIKFENLEIIYAMMRLLVYFLWRDWELWLKFLPLPTT